ncbi:MAG: hypothetical protein AAGA42_02430 [Actinomycetota bacterium]
MKQQVTARDRNECQAARHSMVIGFECRGQHTVHELVRRAQWRDGIYVVENCVLICAAHHDWVHAHPEAAHDVGLLMRLHERPVEWERIADEVLGR